MKQVMKVEMFGQVYAVYHKPGIKYEYKVCAIAGTKIWLDEFESFQEAAEDVLSRLYS